MTTKEKTRNAAKKRRERENLEYSRLCRLLPLPTIITDQLDKASVIRLVITYLNLKGSLQNLGIIYPNLDGNFDDFEDMGSSLVLGLHGFLLTLKPDGTILYVSEAVSVYLGYSQTDIVGNKLANFIHPSDAMSLSAALRPMTGVLPTIYLMFEFSLICSLSLLNYSGKLSSFENEWTIVNACTYYKYWSSDISLDNIINFQGFYCESGENSRSTPIIPGLATTLTFPCFASTDMKLNSDCFVMHLTVDFKIIDFEGRFQSDQSSYCGSFYECVYPADLETIKETHRRAFYIGQSSTKYYRFLIDGCKFFWVVSYVSSTNFSANEKKKENNNSKEVPFFIALTHFLSPADEIL